MKATEKEIGKITLPSASKEELKARYERANESWAKALGVLKSHYDEQVAATNKIYIEMISSILDEAHGKI